MLRNPIFRDTSYSVISQITLIERPMIRMTSLKRVPTPNAPGEMSVDSVAPDCHCGMFSGFARKANTCSTGRLIRMLASCFNMLQAPLERLLIRRHGDTNFDVQVFALRGVEAEQFLCLHAAGLLVMACAAGDGALHRHVQIDKLKPFGHNRVDSSPVAEVVVLRGDDDWPGFRMRAISDEPASTEPCPDDLIGIFRVTVG